MPSNDQLFPFGHVVATKAAVAALAPQEIALALLRHGQGDWGCICDADVSENDRALDVGDRLFSVYEDMNKTRYYVITEADRSVTTVLLPGDY